MNRRHFIELLAKTAAASTVAYSFPSVIVPRNIVIVPSYDEWLLRPHVAAAKLIMVEEIDPDFKAFFLSKTTQKIINSIGRRIPIYATPNFPLDGNP